MKRMLAVLFCLILVAGLGLAAETKVVKEKKPIVIQKRVSSFYKFAGPVNNFSNWVTISQWRQSKAIKEAD